MAVAGAQTSPLAATEKPRDAGPRIQIIERELEFGDVRRGTPIEAIFQIDNIGTETLHILRVQPGWGCSVASFDEVIPAGQSGTVTVMMNTAQLRGLVGKGISIFSDDPRAPSVRVAVRATVYGSVQLLPGYKALLSNRRSTLRSQRFLIRREGYAKGELRVADARASVDWIDVVVTEVVEKIPGTNGEPTALPGDWMLDVALGADVEYGRGTAEVRFRTGLEIEPEVVLAIATDIHPPVTINEDAIRLVAGRPAMVLASLRRDLDPQRVEFGAPDGVQLRTERGRGRIFKIFLDWAGAPPSEPLELTIEVPGERQRIPLVITAN